MNTAVIEAYVDKVYAYAIKRTFTEEEAADLSQEILFTAIRELPKLRDESKLAPWLWGLADNVSKSFRRAQGKQRALISYNVPEGTQPGSTFRLRNKGIQYVNNHGRGDQYVRVNIEVPTNLSGKQKDMLRDFDSSTSDKNYAKRKSFFDKIKDAFKGD